MLVLANTGLGTIPVRSVFADITLDELLTEHNIERAKEGLSPLQYNPALANSAINKAQAMLDSDCWSHYCPGGKSPWEFFEEAGYDYIFAGENLAEGFFSIEDVMIAWMNSETHRANILRSDYTEVGFGLVRGDFQGISNSTVIAVHFGTPASAAQSVTVAGIGNLPTPVITEPQSGSAVNSNDLLVRGVAEGAEEVALFNNNQPWVVADADQGIFTHRVGSLSEGSYNLTAQSQAGAESSDISSVTSFIVDRTPDQINPDQITIVPVGLERVTLQVNAPRLTQITFEIDNVNIDLEQVSQQLWEAEFDLDSLQRSVIAISTIDSAGNEWTGLLSDDELRLASGGNVLSDPIYDVSATVLRSQINWFVLILLIVMFAADFVMLERTGETAPKTHTGLHLALVLVVGIIIITGTAIGGVGSGIQV